MMMLGTNIFHPTNTGNEFEMPSFCHFHTWCQKVDSSKPQGTLVTPLFSSFTCKSAIPQDQGCCPRAHQDPVAILHTPQTKIDTPLQLT